MTEYQIKLVICGLLYDIGKIVAPDVQQMTCNQYGYQFLKEETSIQDEEILDSIRFHKSLQAVNKENVNMAYLVNYADEVAAAVNHYSALEDDVFDKSVPLKSVFNRLNNNEGNSHYDIVEVRGQGNVPFPTLRTGGDSSAYYQFIREGLKEILKDMEYSEGFLQKLMCWMEDRVSYIPCSTMKKELDDISFYDKAKITSAAALCVEQYLKEKGKDNYKEYLFDHFEDAKKEKMFLLYSMDISGIQSFIYTIGSKGALRGLRARSFYLELIMEHMVDELLDATSLCRTVLLYTGGGHCYLLLPNTEAVKKKLELQEKENNHWFLKHFGTALYVACGYEACSMQELRNEPRGSYSELYQKISRMISQKKSHRYTAEEIMRLNTRQHQGERECEICHSTANVDKDDRCSICSVLESFSYDVLNGSLFVVISNQEKNALPLPGNKYLVAETEDQLRDRKRQKKVIRAYAKYGYESKTLNAIRLWIGDYHTKDSFKEFAEKSEGIKRLGVLRADVDNLGTTFVRGFQRQDGDDQYVTISRTAALSRQLSMFFKGYINHLLANGISSSISQGGNRQVAIVYSGGDDVFLVGAWNEVIDSFIDLSNALKKFTLNTLKISGGIGMYPPGYPINIMAKQVAILEDCSKNHQDKNAITIFDETGTYGWDDFKDHVLGEKFSVLKNFFEQSDQRGNAFLYHLLELLRNADEEVNLARYLYLLSRMEPDREKVKEKEAYHIFADHMFEWRKDKEDRQQLITAMYLYVYYTRDKEEDT